ncbi:hypothetical protein llap_10757 [Limosa lapponica baueri]|uniref:G-protein coupled receptors family 1 profile domain-containing protein n=1 Tax=Limosa lapponica baueri TaxID=1758121 RepID=A0A2I0TYS8_LIMLA|nr:hypothetical protein llap_10757 [Limosa lapponica baueri]
MVMELIKERCTFTHLSLRKALSLVCSPQDISDPLLRACQYRDAVLAGGVCRAELKCTVSGEGSVSTVEMGTQKQLPAGTGLYVLRQQMSNGSSITVFLLLAFVDTQELQLLRFWLFLGIYLGALLGNGLIITAIACDHRLHTPMYFFLLNLSLIDLGCVSTTLPKAMANSLWDTRAISFLGCAAQVFLFTFLISAEFCLLTVMAYDHYVAICKPLHYGTLLGSRTCVHMAAAAWGSGFLHTVLHTANTFSLPLCQGNGIDQFF